VQATHESPGHGNEALSRLGKLLAELVERRVALMEGEGPVIAEELIDEELLRSPAETMDRPDLGALVLGRLSGHPREQLEHLLGSIRPRDDVDTPGDRRLRPHLNLR
jgi:hypothetical protein